jgi:hypothetical protein
MNLSVSAYCRIKQHPDNRENLIIETFDNEFVLINDMAVLYRESGMEYLKYFKMDQVSKFGILAGEWLFKRGNFREKYADQEIGIVLANSNGSLDTDMEFYKTIESKDNFFPSPAIFVYTLSNIVMGELCIRHKIKGENAFFVSEMPDFDLLMDYVRNLFESRNMKSVVTGWVDYINGKPDVLLLFVEKGTDEKMEFNKKNIGILY